MAVLASGSVLTEGSPADLVSTLKEQIWRKTIHIDQLDAIQGEHLVISTRLFSGRTVVHVLSESKPQGFDSIPADLGDVYFSSLNTHRSAA
jgi:ABC-2 type transport system ATP-binding protein